MSLPHCVGNMRESTSVGPHTEMTTNQLVRSSVLPEKRSLNRKKFDRDLSKEKWVEEKKLTTLNLELFSYWNFSFRKCNRKCYKNISNVIFTFTTFLNEKETKNNVMNKL